MRRGSIIGLLFASVSAAIVGAMMPPMPVIEPTADPGAAPAMKRAGRSLRGYMLQASYPTPVRTQRGTGAGPGGMHRRWKRLRASGRR